VKLADRVVAVRGAVSGLGADTCCLAASRGARVVAVIDRDAAAAERVAAERVAAEIDGVPITADAADERSVRSVVAELGGVDVSVHNAGIGPKTSTMVQQPPSFSIKAGFDPT
jgi:NAD(P)-dependent dehydrogenase (short-subunit alcohol dehydrogenase family)